MTLENVDIFIIGTFFIRMANAILWTAVCYRVLRHDMPVSRTIRQLIITVILFGMWVLLLGSLVQFGFPGDAARTAYTVFTAYAGLIALGVLTGDDGV